MKKSLIYTGVAALTGLLLFSTGCEWSGGGGSSSFNTSGGAGITVNFSGVYNGTLAGGKAVGSSSGAAITRLVLTQVGNSIEVLDNNGNKYRGSVGSPGLVFTPTETNPTIPAGAQVMQGQISFSGRDGSSGKDVQFAGIVHVVSVTDIKGSSSGSTNSSSSSQSSSDNQSVTTTKTIDDGTNTTTTTTLTIGTPADDFYQQIVTTIVVDNATGVQLSKTVTKTGSSQSSQGQGSRTTTTYQITEANSQYRLEGTWVEKGGNTSDVDALSPATAGLVTQTTAAN